MCNESCILFVAMHLRPEDVHNRNVVNLGSAGFGVGPLVQSWGPAKYVGVDLKPGPGVDVVCNVEQVQGLFEHDHFDVVLSTEMLEHVRDWKKTVAGIKWLCKPGGLVILTTRSLGYPFHAAPHDYWRFEVEDMRWIFSDFSATSVEKDLQEPGVFVAARKPASAYEPVDLSSFNLYSMVEGRRISTIPLGPLGGLRSGQQIWASRLRQALRAIIETLRGRPPGLRFQVDLGSEK